MAVAEPSGMLWDRVKPMIGGWPDSDEESVGRMADAWGAAARSADVAIKGAQRSAVATGASWQDSTGGTMAAALGRPEQTARLMQGFDALAGQARHFGQAVRDTKDAIVGTIAINEPLYRMAAAIPGPIADHFAAAVGRHLNGVIDQKAAEVAGYPAAQPVALATGAGGPGATDLAAARDAFFGPPPPGAQRQILQTGATTPGGEDGIIVSRFYIGDETAAFGQLHGDGRGTTTDPRAGHRFSIAWDTRTGEVSVTVNPSTIDAFSVLNESSVYAQDRHVGAHRITIGPGGSPNNFVVEQAGPGALRVSYNVLNSGIPVPVGQANGEVGIAAIGRNVAVNHRGDHYPDGEFIQYRDEGTRTLATKPMSPHGEFAALGSDQFDETWVLPR